MHLFSLSASSHCPYRIRDVLPQAAWRYLWMRGRLARRQSSRSMFDTGCKVLTKYLNKTCWISESSLGKTSASGIDVMWRECINSLIRARLPSVLRWQQRVNMVICQNRCVENELISRREYSLELGSSKAYPCCHVVLQNRYRKNLELCETGFRENTEDGSGEGWWLDIICCTRGQESLLVEAQKPVISLLQCRCQSPVCVGLLQRVGMWVLCRCVLMEWFTGRGCPGVYLHVSVRVGALWGDHARTG